LAGRCGVTHTNFRARHCGWPRSSRRLPAYGRQAKGARGIAHREPPLNSQL
jgi:hypothetical protein